MSGALIGGYSGPVVPGVARLVRQPTCRIARIHLLGPMRATSYLGDDILPRAKKARAMLAYLCLAFGAKVPRIRLARLLWDQTTDAFARGSLRHALLDACEAMGPLAGELISTGRATIQLNADACWIDALALQESASPDLALFCTGKLLDGLDGVSASFDRWLARERERFKWKTRGLPRPQTVPASSADRQYVSAVSPPYTQTHTHGPVPERSRLRVAVLPFEGIGQEKETEKEGDLALSLSHEVAAALARFRWFDVVAPISLVSRRLNFTSEDFLQRKDLDYAVDGTVNRQGQSIEINFRLLDLTRRTQPVWNQRFALETGELHRLNEIITGRVVGSIDPIILFIEGQPNRREDYGATGLLLLAVPLLHSMERQKFERAGALINQAMEIDPRNAMAAAWAALWHIARVGQGWAQDIAGTLDIAEDLSLKAIGIDPDNAEALGIYAHMCAWRKKFDAAVRNFDRSLRLNPNLAFIWALSAATYCYIGEPAVALQRLKRSRDLAPFHPYWRFLENIYVTAHFFRGDYEQAVLVGRGTVKANPYSHVPYKPLIASLGHLGRAEEAKPYITRLLSLEPHFTVEHFAKTYPIKRPQDRRRYMRGLLLAGVPAR